MKGGPARRTLAAVVLLTSGCAGNSAVQLSQLPDATIALIYREPHEARERAALLRKRREGLEARRGIADLSDIERLLARGSSSRPGLGGQGQLALFDPRRGQATPLPDAPRGAMPLSWSRDRRRLLLSAPVGSRRQLFEFDLRSHESRPLTRGPERHPMGCYFPAGNLAVVQAREKGPGFEMAIGVTGEGGGSLRRLTRGSLDAFPTCSPDGRSVAFTRLRDEGEERIAVVSVDGSHEAREIATGTHPVYTPDGDWIVYSAKTSKGQRIWRVRPDGSGKAPIGSRWEEESDEVLPAVSPDGRFVAYVLKQDDRDRLRLRRIDGRGDRPLLEYGDGIAPIW